MSQTALFRSDLRTDYEVVPAGTVDQVLGATGARGDLLQRLILTVSGADSTVTLKDGNSAAIPISPNTTGNGNGTYAVELGLQAKNVTTPGWKVTTGANVGVLAIGKFT